MADINKRVRYFTGQFLQQEDFTDEQNYHIGQQRHHNKRMHTWGIVEGLDVTANIGATQITVSTGTAIDGEGRQIILTEEVLLPLDQFADKTVFVVIRYHEIPSDKPEGALQETRWHARPKVQPAIDSLLPAEIDIRLAEVEVNSSGTVSKKSDAVRTRAGAVLTNAEMPSLTLKILEPPTDSNLYPKLTATGRIGEGLHGTLDIQGSLRVHDGFIFFEEKIDDNIAKSILTKMTVPCIIIGLTDNEPKLYFRTAEGNILKTSLPPGVKLL